MAFRSSATVDVGALARQLGAAADFRIDWEPFARVCFLILQSHTQLNFHEQRSPDGAAWAPLAKSTLRKRRGKNPRILWDTGLLAASASAEGGEGAVRHVEPTADGLTVEFGSAVPYGRYHQAGTSRMVARPWLGLTDEVVADIAEAAADFAADAVKAALGG